MSISIYDRIVSNKEAGKKQFAVLIDPDDIDIVGIDKLVPLAIEANVDYFFIGGSLIITDNLENSILRIKELCNIPIILFPGSTNQISFKADGLLFLSLISGRNAELLIGKQVEVAPLLINKDIEILSTGYILVDGGRQTTASYMSNTTPLPADKPEIAYSTALAGQLIGFKLIYMDAGSGAKNPISSKMISTVKKSLNIPLILGGGITTPEIAAQKANAGADIIVIGNAIEKDSSLLLKMADAIHNSNKFLK